MSYIGWPTNVNKVILDSTSVTVGENGAIHDSLESGGQKKSRLTCANPPDKFEVKMVFDFVKKGEDGYTELERFFAWYKWIHKYGVNPFKFPAILINSNRKQGYSQEAIEHGKVPDMEYYKIISAVQGSKSGHALEVSMTWETVATGVIIIPDQPSEIDHIIAENGYVDVILTSQPVTEPTELTWTLLINDSAVPVESVEYDDEVTARLYFTRRVVPGTYEVNVGGEISYFTV